MITNIEINYNGPISSLINNIFSPVGSGKIVYVNTGEGSGSSPSSGIALGDYDLIEQYNVSGLSTGIIFSKYFSANRVISGPNFNVDANNLICLGLNEETFAANSSSLDFVDCGLLNNSLNFPNLTGSLYSSFYFSFNSDGHYPEPMTINFPKLKEINGVIVYNGNIAEFNSPELEFIPSLVFQNCRALTSIDLPNLKRFTAINIDNSCTEITGISMPSLTGWNVSAGYDAPDISIYCPLTSLAVDSLLYTILQTSPSVGIISLADLCEPPTAAGLEYKASLQALGVEVYTN